MKAAAPFALFSLVVASSCGAVQTDAELLAIHSSAKTVDNQSKALLGIDIQHISLLMQQSGSSFRRKVDLDQSGEMAILNDLAAKGFIEFKIVRGLPDGSNLNEEFVVYAATDKGKMIVSALTP